MLAISQYLIKNFVTTWLFIQIFLWIIYRWQLCCLSDTCINYSQSLFICFHCTIHILTTVILYKCERLQISVLSHQIFSPLEQKKVLRKIMFIRRIGKRQLKFLGHIMKNEGMLKNLTPIGHIEGKRNKGKQQAIYLTSLCEQMAEQRVGVQMLLRARMDRKLQRAMFTHILKAHGI